MMIGRLGPDNISEAGTRVRSQCTGRKYGKVRVYRRAEAVHKCYRERAAGGSAYIRGARDKDPVIIGPRRCRTAEFHAQSTCAAKRKIGTDVERTDAIVNQRISRRDGATRRGDRLTYRAGSAKRAAAHRNIAGTGAGTARVINEQLT